MFVQNSGTQKIEVIIRKDGGGTQGANETDSDSISTEGGATTGGQATTTKKGLSNKTKRMIKVNVTHGIAVAHQAADLYINYQIQGIGYESGDQNLQDRIQRKVEIVQDVGNFATSVAMGAAYGSTGGPIGAALGAAFGAASSGASLIAKYRNRERDYTYKVFKENNAVEYNRSRAMINETNGRWR